MLLEHQTKRSIITANSLNRRLQVKETLLLQRGHHLCTESTSRGRFVADNQLAGLLYASDDGVGVPWEYGTQIDELAGNTLLGCEVAGLLEGTKLRAPSDDCYVASSLHYFGFSERYFVVLVWYLFYGRAVEYLVVQIKCKMDWK